MKRREFVHLCTASAAGAALPDASAAATLTARKYPRAKLVDEKGLRQRTLNGTRLCRWARFGIARRARLARGMGSGERQYQSGCE